MTDKWDIEEYEEYDMEEYEPTDDRDDSDGYVSPSGSDSAAASYESWVNDVRYR